MDFKMPKTQERSEQLRDNIKSNFITSSVATTTILVISALSFLDSPIEIENRGYS